MPEFKQEMAAPTSDSHNLDFLRATAVSAVVVFHLLLFYGVNIKQLGLFGVLLFFVHTTLVLMFSLDRLRTKDPNKPLWLPFMVRRTFRIYPLSMLVVLLIFALRIPQTGIADHGFRVVAFSWSTFLSDFLLIQNVTNKESVPGVLWSLPYEMQMYLFLPACFLLARRARKIWPVLALWAFSFAVALTPFKHKPSILLYAPCFLPGVLAFYRWQGARKIPAYVWPPFLMLLIGIYVLTGQPAAGWLLCLTLGLAAPLFRELPHSLLTRATKLIAKYSYGIYLSHFFAIWLAFVKLSHWNAVLQWSVFFAALFAIPVGMFHAIEQPGINLGARLAARLPRRRAAAVSAATA